MGAKRAIFVAPFDELVEPATVAELAANQHRVTAPVRRGPRCDRGGTPL